ncbi:unnamed protein product [Ambrosiozyma monospora]|uniref:Unnamed protein product n=1 Tax=Ambrosiozyma monospora TaxID=43982 RepID=A0ACB5TFM0_AMBMO|nr:unnamed protein product [Ambrosiozyma monospora]
MKPIDPYAKRLNSDKDNEASNASAGQASATSSFSWLKNTLSSYIWGPQNNNQPARGSSSAHTNGTPSSSDNNPAQSSSLHYTPATSPQYHDYDGGEISDSQSESVYHSPELRSRSMSPAPQLASSLHSTGGQQNSFNLYGPISQSGLARTTGSAFDLTHASSSFESSSEDVSRVGREGGIGGSTGNSASSPAPLRSVNSANTTSSGSGSGRNAGSGTTTRVNTIHTVGEMNRRDNVNQDVYNGNNLDLEENNDKDKDKEKKESADVGEKGKSD